LDVVNVVPVKLLHLATTKMVSVGKGVPINTKVVLQKALKGGMREQKEKAETDGAMEAPLEQFCSAERTSTWRDSKGPLRPQEVAQLARRYSAFRKA